MSQLSPSRIYSEYFASRIDDLDDGDDSDKGRPSKIARTAAREKFSTEIIDMTVDARQRLRDLSNK